MMQKIYIPSHCSLDEVKQMLDVIEAQGLDPENIMIEDSFAKFFATIDPEKETVVVYSLSCFASMIDLLSVAKMMMIRSVREPWFDQPIDDPRQYLAQLHDLAVEMHAQRTNRGLNKARQEGKKLGRQPKDEKAKNLDQYKIAQVDQLCAQQKLSVVQACKIVGISRFIYYRRRATN